VGDKGLLNNEAEKVQLEKRKPKSLFIALCSLAESLKGLRGYPG
jgi:hypothetical protein